MVVCSTAVHLRRLDITTNNYATHAYSTGRAITRVRQTKHLSRCSIHFSPWRSIP